MTERGDRRGDDGGFGLVEIVVALGVLALVSVVALRAVASGVATSVLGRQQSVAAALIAAADAGLQSADVATLAGLVAHPSTQTTAVAGTPYCLSEGASASASNLYTVTVTVSWPAGATCSGPEHRSSQVQVGGS